MKKIMVTLMFLSLVLCIFAVNEVALLSVAKGRVELNREGKLFKFKTGELLKHNDELRTGGESFAAFKYIDGSSTIKVFSNSVVKVQASASGKSLVKRVVVNKGSVFSQIKPKSGTFMVQTPTTVASVKGTAFLTKLTEDKQSLFIVTEGEVMLKILDDTALKSVTSGKTAVVEADGRYVIRLSTPEDLSELEQTEIEASQELENRIMRIPVLDPAGHLKYIEITH
ncbi:MAG: FecR family protein [Candidatus Cloacimonas sp.]|jgi:hypothetical protein|nr:FecR family protein [Candidatus Cloacimonas sp.]